jgi:hypothetical protein
MLTSPWLARGDSGQGSTKINSALVGAWEIYLPNAAGASHWVFEFRPDGTYTLHAPGLGHSGTYKVPAVGQWSLKAETTNYVDHGTFRLIDPNTLYLQGQFGPGQWKRVSTPLVLPDTPVEGRWLPMGLRPIVAYEVAIARQEWRPDAIPVMLRAKPQPYGPFEVLLSLYSPSSGAGRNV